MEAEEQLASWAAAGNDEVLFWLDYPLSNETALNPGTAYRPREVGRARAGDVLAAFRRDRGGAWTSVTRDVLARFEGKPAETNSLRVEKIKGITFVVVEGHSPVSPHTSYRLLLSSVNSFL